MAAVAVFIIRLLIKATKSAQMVTSDVHLSFSDDERRELKPPRKCAACGQGRRKRYLLFVTRADLDQLRTDLRRIAARDDRRFSALFRRRSHCKVAPAAAADNGHLVAPAPAERMDMISLCRKCSKGLSEESLHELRRKSLDAVCFGDTDGSDVHSVPLQAKRAWSAHVVTYP